MYDIQKMNYNNMIQVIC